MKAEGTGATALGCTEVCERIASRQARIGIIGMGYVGLPLALLFSEEGFPVTGFDIDQEKIRRLNAGESYIAHLPTTELQAAHGRGFSATTDYTDLHNMDAVVICVPTPLDEFHQPDLSFITATGKSLAPHLRAGQLIVLESTTWPGTTEEVLVPLLERGNAGHLRAENHAGAATGAANDQQFFVAFSPEREDPGNNTVARKDVPKVIGAVGPQSLKAASALYSSIFNRTVPVSSTAAAEMTKLLENIYRSVNIALVNELKLLCMRMGLDIFEIIDAAKTKPFGFQAFYPGPGLGGHCIPIDPFYLSWKARQYDFRTRFIELAGEINLQMPYAVVEKTIEAMNERKTTLKGSRVLVLGVAYKRDVDDLRESPALTIIELLRRHGAQVSYNDPYFPFVGRGRHYDLNMTCAPLANLSQYQCVLIVTDHSAYDYARIVRESSLIVDTRNATRGIASPKIVHC